MLKFKVDENLPTEAAALLVSAGHDAMTVANNKWAAIQIQASQQCANVRAA